MSYLVFALLFVTTLGLGFMVGQWWIRKQLDDLAAERERLARTTDYEPHFTALRAQLKALDETSGLSLRLPKLVQGEDTNAVTVDITASLRTLGDRMGAVEASLQALHQADGNKMKRSDATAILERLSSVEASVGAVPKPDLSPINRRIDETQALVRAIELPEPVDLKPVQKQLAAILDTVHGIEVPEAVDLKPIQKQLNAVQEAIGRIRVPEPVDLKPVYKQIASVESAVHAIEIPDPPDPVDLSPVRDKLGDIASRLDAIRIPPRPI